ncbi:Lrp/AsnC family transcriptional regulator [Paraflavitalea sp. CAU 1676]|uniref:Lrp/AsnC family transcriptional regulator n=1 Tax=Paraflavitalea sp. CAU 1676 TaxID=3032598 RepID=UPI0023DC5842|nr:Lrp/AsnC family transcriptional regulator [Paraflavitalea sp. CAU 1676]MDF2192680.1 Lrp/AsnC family transcriptional regulator [Paraflavitalea sp. CAU 1676]
MTAQLDQTDIRILDLLQIDARITTKEIADKLGLTITPVSVRIKKLEQSGYIKRYVAILDKEKIGKNLIAFTTIKLREHTQAALRGFEQKSVKFKEIMECYRLTGNFDFLLKVVISDMQEYNNFLINKLSSLPNIGSVQSSFVLWEGKTETAFPLDLEQVKR